MKISAPTANPQICKRLLFYQGPIVLSGLVFGFDNLNNDSLSSDIVNSPLGCQSRMLLTSRMGTRIFSGDYCSLGHIYISPDPESRCLRAIADIPSEMNNRITFWQDFTVQSFFLLCFRFGQCEPPLRLFER